jgi:hypothetical protein
VGSDSVATAALAAGSYSFIAVYSGDSNFNGSTGPVEPLTVLNTAQIAPTGTTAAQFASGTSTTLPAVFYTDDGTGKIKQNVNPGVFFYFSFVTAPVAGSQTIYVNEHPPTGYNYPFQIVNTSTGNLALYNATGTTVVAGGTPVGTTGSVTFTTPSTTTAGQQFIVLVKYDTKSIVGYPTPKSLGKATTEHYTWTTEAPSGTVQATAGVDLKLSGTQLAPSAGSGVGAANLTEQQLQPVVDEALARWAAAGLNAAQLSTLRSTPIYIATFLDAPRLGVESDGEIWLNANAAGWGWFTDPSAGATPAAGRMDLLTVVEHEFGHVLYGVQNGTGLMEATLAPGVRLFPGSGPMGVALAATPMPGLATRPSAFTVSDHAITLAPYSLSLVTAVRPSTEGADSAATLAARAVGAMSTAALGSAERTQAFVLVASQGPAVPITPGGTGSPLAPYAIRPLWTEAATTAALDLLLSTGEATQPDGEHGTLPGATPDFPAGPQDTALFDQGIDPLFGEGAAPLSDGAIARLFDGEGGLLDGGPGATRAGFSVAAAVLGAGYLLRALDRREERRAQVAIERV